MDRNVPVAFVLLGLVLGVVGQLRNFVPALSGDPTPRPPGAVVLLLGVGLFLLSTVVVAWVGYRTGRTVDLPSEFARFALTAGVAGGVGFLVGSLGVLVAAPVSANDLLVAAVFGIGYNALTKSVSIGLYGLAGAAVAHFGCSEPS